MNQEKQKFCILCEGVILHPSQALKVSKSRNELAHKRCDSIARGIIHETLAERDSLIKGVMSL